MKILKITLVLLIFSFTTCKKEKIDYPIMEIGSYFPVYPGSYWKYLVNDSVLAVDSTNSAYELGYILNSKGDKEFYYVPFYNASSLSPLGHSSQIYKYGRWDHNNIGFCGIWPLLSETIGYTFADHPVGTLPSEAIHFIVKAKRFDGKDSVLIQEGTYFIDYWDLPVTSEKVHQEFIKGVGLALDIVYDTITYDTISKKILVDYYISNKTDL
jgi:hypothetical protein